MILGLLAAFLVVTERAGLSRWRLISSYHLKDTHRRPAGDPNVSSEAFLGDVLEDLGLPEILEAWRPVGCGGAWGRPEFDTSMGHFCRRLARDGGNYIYIYIYTTDPARDGYCEQPLVFTHPPSWIMGQK